MSYENVQLVQGALEHFAATGEPDYTLLDEDVEVHDHDILDAGEYRGHEGVKRWLMDWSSAWADTVFEPQEFLEAGDRVVVVGAQRVTGGGSGVVIERQDAIIWALRASKIVRIDYYNSRQQALDAAGLRE